MPVRLPAYASRLIFGAAALIVAAGFLCAATQAEGAVPHPPRRKHLPLDRLGYVKMKDPETSSYFHDRVIVKLAQGETLPAGGAKTVAAFGISALDRMAQRYSAQSITRAFPEAPAPRHEGDVDLSRFYVMKYSSPVDAFNLAKEMSALGEVEYAEPWFIYPTTGTQVFTPNDSLYNLQWALRVIRADSAWSVGQGDTSVVIGIVDTGLQWDHPDLAGNVWINPGEIGLDGMGRDKRTNGIDDDGDGKIDDWHGWDFGGADYNNVVEDNDTRPTGDNTAHGTHVAGIASGVTDNHTGVAGVGFHCRLLGVKTSADNDTRASGFAYIIAGFQGIVYAAQMGAKVISCSWGGPGASQFEQDVVNYATAQGALIVAAAGNGGSSNPSYPSGYDHVISVAATDGADIRETYSNYGTTIDVCAPGGDFSGANSTILSTYYPSTYAGLAGTSQATPQVSGVAALVKARFPSYNAIQVGEQVRVTCDDISGANPSFINKLGRGRLNAYRALTGSSPSLRMTSMTLRDSAGGNNNGVAEPNETVSIVAEFTNYLQPTSAGAAVTLSVSDTIIQILSSGFNAGSVATLDSVSNANAPFVFHVGPNVPQTYPVDFMLTMSDGSYHDVQFFTVLINPSYATHDGNNVLTTLSNRGNIGFNDFDQNSQGVGFIYGGDNQLFEGGLMIGTSPSKVVDVVRNPALGEDRDFSSTGVYSIRIPGLVSGQDGRTVFSDSAAPASNRLGVRVNMYSYQYGTDPDRDYVIVRYDIRNTSGATLSNLYAGLFFDWDVHDPGDVDGSYYAHNRTSFDQSRNLGYSWYDTTAPTVYCGASTLDGAGGYAGLVRDSVTGSRAEKWSWMSGGVNLTSRVDDIHFVVSSGPYTIGDGGVQTVGFALLGGVGLPGLQAHADAALEKWNYIKSLQGARPRVAVAIHQNPVLSKFADLYVSSDLPLADPPTLSVRTGTASPDTVSLALISPGLYKGAYQFSLSGTSTIRVSAVGVSGLDTVATRTFNVQLLKSGIAGSIAEPERNAILQVPEGALAEDTYFTAAREARTDQQATRIGNVYTFGPARAFSSPMTLTLQYPRSAIMRGTERFLRIARVEEMKFTPLKSWVDAGTSTVTASVDALGSFALVYDETGGGTVPLSYRLEQNFPNPFNPQTVIRFQIPEEGRVLLRVFDIMGREVAHLIDEERGAGFYEVVWDGTGASQAPLPSGIYFCAMEVFQSGRIAFTQTQKMSIIR